MAAYCSSSFFWSRGGREEIEVHKEAGGGGGNRANIRPCLQNQRQPRSLEPVTIHWVNKAFTKWTVGQINDMACLDSYHCNQISYCVIADRLLRLLCVRWVFLKLTQTFCCLWSDVLVRCMFFFLFLASPNNVVSVGVPTPPLPLITISRKPK